MGEGDHTDKQSYEAAPVQKMATAGPLWKVRYYVHSVGDVKVGREVTIGQLGAAILGFVLTLIAVNIVRNLLNGFGPGWVPVVIALAVAFLIPRGISLVEDAGRPPYVEIYRFLNFWLFAPRYYCGARTVSGMTRKRLQEMFAREQSKGGRPRTAALILKEGLADTARSVRGRSDG